MLLSTLHAWCQMVCWSSSPPMGSSKTALTSGRTRLWEGLVWQQLAQITALRNLHSKFLLMVVVQASLQSQVIQGLLFCT